MEKLIRYVAECFKKTMMEEGFETFSEMSRCYDWGTREIKEEMSNIIFESGYGCLGDGYLELDSGEYMEYKKFSAAVRRICNE